MEEQNSHENEVVRVRRVSRIFGHFPVVVRVHTEDGRLERIKILDEDHIDPDTGSLTPSGWDFLEREIERIFGAFEWMCPGSEK